MSLGIAPCGQSFTPWTPSRSSTSSASSVARGGTPRAGQGVRHFRGDFPAQRLHHLRHQRPAGPPLEQAVADQDGQRQAAAGRDGDVDRPLPQLGRRGEVTRNRLVVVGPADDGAADMCTIADDCVVHYERLSRRRPGRRRPGGVPRIVPPGGSTGGGIAESIRGATQRTRLAPASSTPRASAPPPSRRRR